MAEELTQETFYQAVKSVKRYDGMCKVSTWLCQIAKHLWYRELDKRRRKGTSQLVEEIISNEQTLDERIAQKEEILEVFKRVHVLDDVSKNMFREKL